MSIPALILWAIVFCVGVPSAWRNPTAAALVVAWLAGEAIFLITGDSLAVQFYLFPDIFVIAVIMSKEDPCNHRSYRGMLRQLECIVFDRSVPDRIVMLIFPVMWGLYLAPLHPYYVWWGLWLLVVIQFLAAGWESFSIYRRDHRAVSDTPDNPGALLVAYESGGYG